MCDCGNVNFSEFVDMAEKLHNSNSSLNGIYDTVSLLIKKVEDLERSVDVIEKRIDDLRQAQVGLSSVISNNRKL